MHLDILVTLNAYQQEDLPFIEEQWLALEQQSNSSFFLTWTWIGSWLTELCFEQQPFYLLCAKQNGSIVGLSIVVKKHRKVLGLFTIEQWWLNRSGNEQFDQCWIEENSFLTTVSNQFNIEQAMLSFIQQDDTWQEFVLGMSDQKTIHRFSSLTAYSHILHDDKGYKLSYENVNNSDDYINTILSRNTRQKLKQSERLLEIDGQLSIKLLLTHTEKLEHINVISKLHRKRWKKTLIPSGFTNHSFTRFFTKVIQNEHVEILCLMQSNKALGYLIFFVHNKKVYFYLSALTSNNDNKIKLGMLFHQKAILHYLHLGVSEYDFLAGDARYKKSLTNDSYSQQMVVFYRSIFILNIETHLKKLNKKFKNFLQNLSQ